MNVNSLNESVKKIALELFRINSRVFVTMLGRTPSHIHSELYFDFRAIQGVFILSQGDGRMRLYEVVNDYGHGLVVIDDMDCNYEFDEIIELISKRLGYRSYGNIEELIKRNSHLNFYEITLGEVFKFQTFTRKVF